MRESVLLVPREGGDERGKERRREGRQGRRGKRRERRVIGESLVVIFKTRNGRTC